MKNEYNKYAMLRLFSITPPDTEQALNLYQLISFNCYYFGFISINCFAVNRFIAFYPEFILSKGIKT